MTTITITKEDIEKAEATNAKVRDMLGRAKANLILEQPFYASIICNLPFIERFDIPTLATNGDWVAYNPTFLAPFSLDEVKWALCHEVLHCVFDHMFRRGQRDRVKWNIAGDYVINQLLEDEKIGKRIDGTLFDPNIVAAGGGTTDGVYDILPENAGGDGSGRCDGSGSFDDVIDSGGTDAEKAEAEARMKVAIAQAAQAAKMCGKLSANMERLVNLGLKSRVDWRDVLRRFVSARAKVDYTFGRPKRRFLAEDMYLPSMSGERMGEILIAVDCSGSIGPDELDEFATEIHAIKEDMLPSMIHVIYFSHEVTHVESYDTDDSLDIKGHGGGGTAFSPIFVEAANRDFDVACCVVLTDLYCGDFGPPTPYPTLWVSNGASEAPWGEVVMMKDTGER